MPYFDRIRQLAAARGAPGGRRMPGLEVDEVRLAEPPPPRAASARAARPAAPVAAPTAGRHETTEVVREAPVTPRAEERVVVATEESRIVEVVATAAGVPEGGEARVAAAPALPAASTLREETRVDVVTGAPPVTGDDPAATPPASPPPAARPLPPAAVVPAAPAERIHDVLAEVRAWMEQPAPTPETATAAERPALPASPVRRTADRTAPAPRRRAPAAVTEPPATELSIGTIEVTVEEAPAPRAAIPAPPPPARPAPERPARDVVPSDYLRGW
jgi:hypothetical protein